MFFSAVNAALKLMTAYGNVHKKAFVQRKQFWQIIPPDNEK